MNALSATAPRPAPLQGTMRIVVFNWPQYAAAVLLAAAGIGLSRLVKLPWFVELPLLTAVGLTMGWSLASLIASYWIYDCSELTQWRWLANVVLASKARRWVNIHAGFDDTTAALRRLLTGTPAAVVDLFDPMLMTERSIHRARRVSKKDAATVVGQPDALPLPDASFDIVFILMAAHELRLPRHREELFDEVRRSLCPGGSLVVVEHVRDLWNFLAFGPGFLHFFSAAEWRRLGRYAGLTLKAEGRVTPFIRYFIMER